MFVKNLGVLKSTMSNQGRNLFVGGAKTALYWRSVAFEDEFELTEVSGWGELVIEGFWIIDCLATECDWTFGEPWVGGWMLLDELHDAFVCWLFWSKIGLSSKPFWFNENLLFRKFDHGIAGGPSEAIDILLAPFSSKMFCKIERAAGLMLLDEEGVERWFGAAGLRAIFDNIGGTMVATTFFVDNKGTDGWFFFFSSI